VVLNTLDSDKLRDRAVAVTPMTKGRHAGRRWGLKANGTPTGRPTKSLFRDESV